MSDMDDLVVTFQTQFSAVMETILKTAMYEVTRLVEDGFMDAVRHRDREVESLRTQLQWAARRRRGRCLDCEKADVEVSCEGAEDTATEYQYSVLSGCGLKQEDNSVDKWTRGCGQEVMSEATQEADKPTVILSPVKESEVIEEDSMSPGLNVKEEEIPKQSCSVEHSGGWAVSHDGGAESESCSFSEMTETAQQSNEEFLRTVIKQDLEISTTNTFTEDQADTHTQSTHVITEATGFSSVKIDCKQASLTLMTTGLLQNHSLGARKEGETATIIPSPKQMGHKLADPTTDILRAALANPPLVRDQSSSSQSPEARPPISDVGSVVIKQEIIVDSDGSEEGEKVGEEKATRPGMGASSFLLNQYRVRPEVLRQKHISHKPAVQEVMKLQSKVGTSLSLQAAVQHPHRPIRKLPQTPPTSTSTSPSIPHSQLANFHPFNRAPSISKPTPPPPLSLQRAHHGDKRPVTLTRTSTPWVSIKTHHQAANSHHLHPHPGSHTHLGPKHLLRCGQCGKCFPHPSNLKAHQQTHTGERPFCCSLCGRSFTKLSNLKAHRRVHTGERPYCCSACGKRFTQKCNLKRHQRIHLDV